VAQLSHAFRPDPDVAPLPDPSAAKKALAHWRWRMFAGFFLGYFVLYFSRMDMSVAAPELAKDLSLSNVRLGTITTTFFVVYGVGKFLNGVLADRANLRG